MKNLFVLMMMVSMIAACSPTRHDMKTSRRVERTSAYASNEPSDVVYYASTKRMISVTNDRDSLQRKIDQAQLEMFRKIEKDKAESLEKLKRSMTTKVYTTTLAVDVKKSSLTVEEDTVYSVKGGGWVAVE